MVVVAAGTSILGRLKSNASTELKPLTEGGGICEVGGINAPTFTYRGGLITLPFEGWTNCTNSLPQTGQAVLETASGTVVASGNAYAETAKRASSNGVGTSLLPGNYVIVYTETIYSPNGWTNTEKAPFCTIDGDYLSCTKTDAFPLRIPVPPPEETLGGNNAASPHMEPPCTGDPIDCATGNLAETQTDLSVGGRGPGLNAVRTYNSLTAPEAKEAGPFGYAWTGPYSAHLVVNTELETAKVDQDNGSSVTFIFNSTAKEYTAAPWVQATLKKEGSDYIYTLPDQTKLEFNSEGRVTKESERNGNAITLAYNAAKELETATDGAGRKLTFKYTAGGQVESITDPMGHVVKYAYESGNLVSVTLPGEASPRWRFEYSASHLLTAMTDGRGNTTRNEYNASNQVSSQTDPLKRKRELKYAALESGTETKIIEPNGSETVELFNTAGLPTKITRASGTGLATTTEYEYNGSYELTAVTDPNKHTTKYGYDSAGDRTSQTDANGNETKWTYDSTHDVETLTTPKGETTTIKRNADGDPEVTERPRRKAKRRRLLTNMTHMGI
jgi:YD repeat-containing protein